MFELGLNAQEFLQGVIRMQSSLIAAAACLSMCQLPDFTKCQSLSDALDLFDRTVKSMKPADFAKALATGQGPNEDIAAWIYVDGHTEYPDERLSRAIGTEMLASKQLRKRIVRALLRGGDEDFGSQLNFKFAPLQWRLLLEDYPARWPETGVRMFKDWEGLKMPYGRSAERFLVCFCVSKEILAVPNDPEVVQPRDILENLSRMADYWERNKHQLVLGKEGVLRIGTRSELESQDRAFRARVAAQAKLIERGEGSLGGLLTPRAPTNGVDGTSIFFPHEDFQPKFARRPDQPPPTKPNAAPKVR